MGDRGRDAQDGHDERAQYSETSHEIASLYRIATTGGEGE
jgi:hypothetical protein